MNAPRPYRGTVHNSVLNYYSTKQEACEYLDILTVDNRPGRDVGGMIEYDPNAEWDWQPVPTAKGHLHHGHSGWRKCWKLDS